MFFCKNELNAGRYVLASTELTFSKERHAIVITGYYYENSSIIYTFFDPASANYKSFTNGDLSNSTIMANAKLNHIIYCRWNIIAYVVGELNEKKCIGC